MSEVGQASMPTPSRWRQSLRLRLSLRAFMVCVLIFGVGLSWIVRLARDQRQAVEAIRQAKGDVVYESDRSSDLSLPAALIPRWLAERLDRDYFENVTGVGFHITPASDDLMRHVGRLHHLKWLNLNGRVGITDAGLNHLRGLTRLVSLDLSGSSVQGPGLAYLAEMDQLQTLHLYNLSLNDADLPHLQGLAALESLAISGPRITDMAFAHLKSLTNLKSLSVSGSSQVRGTGLKHLAGLPSLSTLLLANTPLDDADLVPIAKLIGLVNLDLSGTQITDAGLAQLVPLTALESLNLGNTKVSDPGLAYLAKMPSLTLLYLARTQISDDGLVHLAALSKLLFLDLGGTRITNAGLTHLKGLTMCRQVVATGTNVTPAGAAAMMAISPGMLVIP